MPLTWNLPPHPHLVVSDRPRSTPLPHPLLTSTLTLPTYRKWSSRWDRTPWCYRRLSRGRRWSLICIRLRLAVWGRNGINSGKGWGPTKGNKFFTNFFLCFIKYIKNFLHQRKWKTLGKGLWKLFLTKFFILFVVYFFCISETDKLRVRLKLERFFNFFFWGGRVVLLFVCSLFVHCF